MHILSDVPRPLENIPGTVSHFVYTFNSEFEVFSCKSHLVIVNSIKNQSVIYIVNSQNKLDVKEFRIS